MNWKWYLYDTTDRNLEWIKRYRTRAEAEQDRKRYTEAYGHPFGLRRNP